MEPIKIINLNGVQKRIAEAIDDGDKVLKGSEISVFNEVNKILEECKDAPQGALERLADFFKTASAPILSCINNLKELVVQILSQDSASKAQQIGKISGSSTVKYNNIEINEDILNQAVNNRVQRYLKIHHGTKSALLNSAASFMQQAKEKGVDPFILLAIAMYESSYGTSSAAIKSNNIGGLKANGKVIQYKDINRSIEVAADTLSRNSKHVTLQNVAMQGNYCCDSQPDRQRWCNNIVSIANGLRQEYNRLLSGAK